MAATVTAVAALPESASAQVSAQAIALASPSASHLPSISLSSSSFTRHSMATSTTKASSAAAQHSMSSSSSSSSKLFPSSSSFPSTTSSSIQDRLNELRKQLKAWERDFVAANGGRKAGREDIKADVIFAAKYKEYNALRDQVAGRGRGVSEGKKGVGRMKEEEKESAGRGGERNMGSEDALGCASSLSTPKRDNRKIKSKKMCIVEKVKGTGEVVGREDKIQEAGTDENQQDQEHQFQATPSRTRVMLGPTPQKDGMVLGLFDLLSPSVGLSSTGAVGAGTGAGSIIAEAMTPSKGDRSRLREITGNSTLSLQAMTPRKNRYSAFGGIGANGENVFDAADADDVENDFVNRKGSRTPTSAGKRYLLDSFVTPRKRRRCDGAGSVDATPSSIAKRFMTPQFLRREAPVMMDTLVEDDGDGDGGGAVAGDGLGGLGMRVGLSSRARQPWKRKGLVRSLSSMIQGLRKQEDERLDEEMDIMIDIEGGCGESVLLKEKKKNNNNTRDKNDDTEESKATMVVVESQIASTLDADGLVSMAEDNNRIAVGEGDAAVPARKKKGQKRQTRRAILRPTKAKTKQDLQQQQESHSAPIREGEDEAHTGPGIDEERVEGRLVGGSGNTGATKTGSIEDSAPKSKGVASKAKAEGMGKRARKVNEQAHANYRRLKIKSKLSKGGGKGRFGRGRR